MSSGKSISKRPEHVAPPELFYNPEEAQKYAFNSRMVEIQTQMTERAVELLKLPDRKCYLLDIGCGSGLSGEVLTEKGHMWTGIDISPSMLGVAVQREVEGDLIEADMGDGLMFTPGVFDGCISISALQWLCQSDRRQDIPRERLKRFFVSLYACLAGGARAVFQFYPETDQQLKLIMDSATRAGFSGGLVVEYPNSRAAKKYFLTLVAGEGHIRGNEISVMDIHEENNDTQTNPSSSSSSSSRFVPPETVRYEKGVNRKTQRKLMAKQRRQAKGRPGVKSYDWIIKKKETQRLQGKKTAQDSKYTGRSRRHGF